jgi:catechol 2,3-dioxygenase-like lactoylglutathione lyase family enzyme
MTVWYHVRDLERGRAFYRDKLGFTEIYFDADGRWSKLEHGGMEIALAEGEPLDDGAVAHVDVNDVKAEAARLRGDGVRVGVVFELHGEMRLLDVYDPDGNRIQLAQDVSDYGRGSE